MGRLGILLGIMVIALFLVTWFSRTSTARQKWLANLELPGSWPQDVPPDGGDPLFITFSGVLTKGSYELRRKDIAKQGTWRISQSSLILSDTGGDEFTYEIRFFEKGKIGLHGGDLDHQTFNKHTDNIVPLRRS
ncbi:MAG: hypothetical protein F4Z01_08570 [Gammaproteobacteria bacterium]|nr:hypothetical protein [Gammaproteobacteria bacterium]